MGFWIVYAAGRISRHGGNHERSRPQGSNVEATQDAVAIDAEAYRIRESGRTQMIVIGLGFLMIVLLVMGAINPNRRR